MAITNQIAQFGRGTASGVTNAFRAGGQDRERQDYRNEVLGMQKAQHRNALAAQGAQAEAQKRQQAMEATRGFVQTGFSLMDDPDQLNNAYRGYRQRLQEIGVDTEGDPEQIDRSTLIQLAGKVGVPMPGPEKPSIGTYNPRDYTTESFAEFAQSGDPSVLERFGSQRNVDIGGVPHRFDPVKGGYFPAVVGGQPQGAGPQAQGAQGPGRQPAATGGQAVTPETVGESRATIAQMEAERTPPKGMRFNDQGRLVPIEGSPEQREMQRTRQKSKEILDRRVPGVLRDITRAMEEADQAGPIAGSFARTNPEAGRLTRASAAMSPAYELNQHLDSIKSNISLEELQSMREASPTGGALGQVPVRQQEYLMQIQGSLNPELPPETLRENLSRVGNNYAEMYLDALYGDEAEWEQAIEDGRATPEQAQMMLQEKEKMAKETLRDTGFDQFGRRYNGEPAKPSSQQEYDALPSGAIFIDPDDGKRYRKP